MHPCFGEYHTQHEHWLITHCNRGKHWKLFVHLHILDLNDFQLNSSIQSLLGSHVSLWPVDCCWKSPLAIALKVCPPLLLVLVPSLKSVDTMALSEPCCRASRVLSCSCKLPAYGIYSPLCTVTSSFLSWWTISALVDSLCFFPKPINRTVL